MTSALLGRLDALEQRLDDLTEQGDESADLSALPFWSRLSDALAAGDLAEVLRDWELPRRLAMILREAERGGDTILAAYAFRWREILWGGDGPQLPPIELLTDIRARLRSLLLSHEPL
jgi:hypothetical protein